MDDIQYHIIQQRLLVKANIFNAFECNDDEIQKSPAYTTDSPLHEHVDKLEPHNGNHKYTGKHISKNGKLIYEYAKRVQGIIKDVLDKKTNKQMEITIDTEGKSIKRYGDAEIKSIKTLLINDLHVDPSKIKERSSASTTSSYLKFFYNKRRYDIRLSDHTYKIPKDEHKILHNCRYEQKVFIIEAPVFNYTPKDIIECVSSLDGSLKFFQTKKNKNSVRQFVKDNCDKVGEDTYDDYELYPYNIAIELAGIYIKQHEIKEDKFNTKFHALRSIIEKELERINHDLSD